MFLLYIVQMFGRQRLEDSDQPEGKPRTIFDNELYVGGLNFATSKEAVEKHFSPFGEVLRVDLQTKSQSSKNEGYAFVAFKETSVANEAMVNSNPEVGEAATSVYTLKINLCIQIVHLSV